MGAIRRIRLVAILAVFATVTSMFGIAAAPAAYAVTGSNFESADGNLLVDTLGNKDWQNAPNLVVGNDVFNASNDDIYGGAKEDDQNPPIIISSSPSKDDFKRFYVSNEQIGNDIFLYLAWVRFSNNGASDMDFELNASNTLVNGTPVRTAGDLLITYTFGGSGAPTISMLTWKTSGTCEANSSSPPCWGSKINLSTAGFADGAVNLGALPVLDPIANESLATKTFGEAGINLTAAGIFASGCRTFGHATAKSRTSGSFNSLLKDFVAPVATNISNCSVSHLAKAVRNVTTGGSFATSASASPGDVIEYQLTYTNSGNSAASNVTITDPVPDHSTYDSCTGGTSCGESGGTVTWDVGSVAPGGTATVTFQVTLDSSFTDTTTPITNVGHATTADEPNGTDSNEATVTVTANPDSHLAKAVRNVTTGGTFATSATASPGDTIEYQLTYTNNGPGPAHGVTITDPVPDHSTYSSCTGGTSCGESSGTITWTIGDVPAGGTVTVTFQVVLDSTFSQNSTTITNVGTEHDQSGDHDSNEADVTVSAEPASALTKSATNVDTGQSGTTIQASPGDTIEYTLVYTNEGSGPAVGVTVTDPVPDHSTYLSCTGGTTCGEAGGTVTWVIGMVAPGDSVTLTFRVQLDSQFDQNHTTITNVATAHDQNGDTDSPPVNVEVDAEPASALDKSAADVTHPDGPVTPGDTIEYTITYTNNGSGPANNVTVTDNIPAKTTFVSCDNECTVDGSTVTWSLGTVAAGDSVTLTLRVQLDPGFPSGATEVCNTASVTDQNVTVESPAACVTVSASPDLHVAKAADGTSFAAGQLITYTITYSNTGNGDATNVTITDPIPAGTEFVSCSDNCTHNGTAEWNVGTVPAGGTGFVTLTVRVLASVGCQICNTAFVSSPNQPGDPVPSEQLCVNGEPGPRPELASADGSAFGLLLQVPALTIDETHEQVSSSQSGIGSDSHSNSALDLEIPPPTGEVASVQLLPASSTSTVSEEPAQSTATSSGAAAAVNVLNGLVTADAAKAVATATAHGTGSSVSSTGSTLVNVVVNGITIVDVAPNTRIQLPLLGPDAYVELYERIPSTRLNTDSDIPTYEATMTVNMIHVHIPGLAEVIVGHATAHAAFPQITVCGDQNNPLVSGHAFVASADTNPQLVTPIVEGFSGILPTGGEAHQNLLSVTVPTDGSVLTTSEAESDSSGGTTTPASAASHAHVADVCILRDATTGVCTIAATAVQSNASASSSGSSGSSQILGLAINGGPPVDISSTPNQVIEIPGLVRIVLNEQTCENDGDLSAGCTGGTVDGHTGITVRAIHVTVLGGTGAAPGAEVIVAESHADA